MGKSNSYFMGDERDHMLKKRNDSKKKDSGVKTVGQIKDSSTDMATELTDESLESIAGGVRIVPANGDENAYSQHKSARNG